MRKRGVLTLALVLALASPAVFAAEPAAAPLTLEMLYNSPSIIGTAPRGMTWSPDGKRLAFLWDDAGSNVRDVWIYTPATGKKERVTANGKDAPSKSLDGGGGVSQVVWLPAGKGLAYTVGGKLYTITPGGQPAQLEAGHKGIGQLSISPAGERMAFVADGGALWLRGAGAGGAPARELVPSEPNLVVQSYQWNDAGDHIALVQADERGLRQVDIHYDADGKAQVNHLVRLFPSDKTTMSRVGTLAVDAGAVKWLDRGNLEDPVWGYGLSANGKKLFVNSSDFLVKTLTIDLYDTESGSHETLYQNTDPKRNSAASSTAVDNRQLTWAPGEDGLIMLSEHEGHDQLYLLKAGEAPKRLIKDDLEVASFKVDAKDGLIYFVSNKSHFADRQLYRLSTKTGETEQVTREPGTHDPVYSPDFAYVADFFSNDMTPPDLYLRNLRGSASATQITKSPQPEFFQRQWAKVRYETLPSHVDGTPLMARISLPPDYDPSRRYPLIVGSVYTDAVRNQWGGRNSHPSWGLDQYLTAHGYIVMNVTMRGSWGFGKTFKQGLNAYGGIDIDDMESGVRYMVSKGYADPKRVGVWGSSYGGLLTLMSLFKKPEVYAVGIAGAPASNVWHAYPSQMRVMGEPKGEGYPERYEQQSAYYHSEGLQDPLMIIHGTKDSTVLYSDTVALQQKLIAQGKPFELVSVPGSEHKWDDNSNTETRFFFHKMVEFFDRYLKPGSETESEKK